MERSLAHLPARRKCVASGGEIPEDLEAFAEMMTLRMMI
jgi:hypothetical protein